MAEWIGHWLGSLPSWLFLPALIVFIIIATVLWFIFGPAGNGPLSEVVFPSKKADLGEKKKNGKK